MKGSALFHFVFRVGVACLVLFIPAANAQELPDASSLLSHLKMDPGLEFCNVRVSSQNDGFRERFEKELLLILWNRPQVILWLKRSRRYFPIIESLLKANDLPDDLKYIAVVESALLPYVRSRKQAVGFWQFIYSTGRKYGLKIDSYEDERRNIFASTAAAILYLRDLYQEFGSWELAAAAYNMGEDRLTAEILEQGTNNYFDLYLPLETQRYFFRILTVKSIFSAPEKYGFNLDEDDYYLPFSFDQVQLECPRDIPIRIIAQAGDTSFKRIKDLNPELRGHYLPKGTHAILIPKGASEEFAGMYTSLVNKYLATQETSVYIVQKGDNLTAIADRFNVPLTNLINWNRIDLNRPIHPGQRLTIYTKKIETDISHTGDGEEQPG